MEERNRLPGAVSAVKRSKRKAVAAVTIHAPQEIGEELLREITELLRKENRRRAAAGGWRVGYSVELISSSSS